MDDAPIPDQIDTLSFESGLGYRFNEHWTLAVSVGPWFYRLDDIHSDDIGIGGTILATFNAQPNLTFGLGANVELDRQVPVLPAAGLRWGIQTNLTLDLMWPKSALIYRVQKQLDVFVDGGGNFTVFRTGQNFGNNIGQPGFNNALGTYREFRVGGGAEYRLLDGLALVVEGGYSVGREIDYKRIDETLSFAPRPYAQIGLRTRF